MSLNALRRSAELLRLTLEGLRELLQLICSLQWLPAFIVLSQLILRTGERQVRLHQFVVVFRDLHLELLQLVLIAIETALGLCQLFTTLIECSLELEQRTRERTLLL